MNEQKKNTKKVLIVEDEMIIALMIERMLQNMGHEAVGKAASGEEAVRAALMLKPDLILMDIRLQGEMDGIEAMSEIHKQVKIPVIYITGNTDSMYRKRIEETEYIDYLTKPITIQDLNRSFNFAS